MHDDLAGRFFKCIRSMPFEEQHDAYFEAFKKIEQTHYLFRKAQELEMQARAHKFGSPMYMSAMFELDIVTEAFYHFGFRVFKLLERKGVFTGFVPLGVRDVRNHLVVHPEGQKDKAKVSCSFGFGGPNGPQIKGYIGPEGSYEDKGLNVNAEEFFSKLSGLLNARGC